MLGPLSLQTSYPLDTVEETECSYNGPTRCYGSASGRIRRARRTSRRLQEACARRGSREDRPFHPHLTICATAKAASAVHLRGRTKGRRFRTCRRSGRRVLVISSEPAGGIQMTRPSRDIGWNVGANAGGNGTKHFPFSFISLSPFHNFPFLIAIRGLLFRASARAFVDRRDPNEKRMEDLLLACVSPAVCLYQGGNCPRLRRRGAGSPSFARRAKTFLNCSDAG